MRYFTVATEWQLNIVAYKQAQHNNNKHSVRSKWFEGSTAPEYYNCNQVDLH